MKCEKIVSNEILLIKSNQRKKKCQKAHMILKLKGIIILINEKVQLIH